MARARRPRYSNGVARSRTKAFACVAALLLAAMGEAGALEAFRPDLSVVVVQNLDTSSQTPSLVTNLLGSGIVVPLGGIEFLSFEPSADFYWAYYELSDKGRPVPTGVEDRDAFVIAFLVDLPLVASLRIGEDWRLALGVGAGFNLRLGISAAEEVPAEDVASINAYFWGHGRFFLPSTFLRAEYRLTERVEFGFAARAYWPVFNRWIREEGLPWLDQGIFGGSLTVRYSLR